MQYALNRFIPYYDYFIDIICVTHSGITLKKYQTSNLNGLFGFRLVKEILHT